MSRIAHDAERFPAHRKKTSTNESEGQTRSSIGNNPHDVDFREIIPWLTDHGFTLDRVEGSHHIFSHPKGKLLDLQPDRNGKAKAYQVKQAIRTLNELKQYGA